MPPPEPEFVYDVFISYSHKDGAWVHNELLPRLKGAGLKVCIDSESYGPGEPFTLGRPVSAAIEQAVQTSRKTICVFSPAYLESVWCKDELNVTRTLDPGSVQLRLVPIKIQACELPVGAGGLLYAGFTQTGSQEREWDKLFKAVVPPGKRPPTVTVPPPTKKPTPPAPKAGATKVLPKDGSVLVYVPAGEFWMGSTDADPQASDNEKPPHSVYLDGYWIGRTPVTNAQFRKFIEAGGYYQREYWTDEGWQWKKELKITQPEYWDEQEWNQPDYPVVGVSWYEAAAYARWAGARLPTEAEWEKAARGTDGRIWPWGYQFDTRKANTKESGIGHTTPVGSYPAGASPYGALDMAGNVWEWVADWYEEKYYEYSPAQNPTGPASGNMRVLRGGSWGSDRRRARCACRGGNGPNDRYRSSGFRVLAAGGGLAL